MVDVPALRELAIAVALDAGVMLQRFAAGRAAGDDLGVTDKSSGTDHVSEADRAAERSIAQALSDMRPDDGMLGEEDQATRRGTTGLTWVVDPLDGTTNFLYGYPAWCVSVGCTDARGPLVGAVVDPTRGETWSAARGAGATLTGSDGAERTLACSDVAALGDALVATGFGYDPAVRADQGRDVASLLPLARDVRRSGSAALDLCWCAAGRVDAFYEFGLGPWDWTAGRLLVLEAGGVASDHRRRIGDGERTGIVAGGRAAHDHVVAWLEGGA